MRGSVFALSLGLGCASTPPPKSIEKPVVIHQKAASDTVIRGRAVAILSQSPAAQTAAWRAIVEDKDADPRLVREAAMQLGRLRDDGSGPALVRLLRRSEDHTTVAAIAMALLEMRGAAGAAKALKEKLAVATSLDRAALALCLLHVGVLDDALFEALRMGEIDALRNADGEIAFDPSTACREGDKARYRELAKDPAPRVRTLAATCLSRDVAASDVGLLSTLVEDKELTVTGAAAVGLARSGSTSALVARMSFADQVADERLRSVLVHAWRDALGGAGLLRALDIVPNGLADEEQRARFILDALVSFADPSGAQAYVSYLADPKHPPHYRARVAVTLGEVGDVAAFPYLAERMDADGIGASCGSKPTPQCRSSNLGWKHVPPVGADPFTFAEQQTAARLIGDLAWLFSHRKSQFLPVAAPHLAKFASWFPAPWLVVTRAQSLLGDPKTLAWAKSTVTTWKLPPESLVDLGSDPSCKGPGCRVFLTNAFASATRSLGWFGDKSLVDVLAQQLARPLGKSGAPVGLSQADMELAPNPGFREAALYASQAAADGLAEIVLAGGATPKLIDVIEDRNHGLWARLAAARALGRVAGQAELSNRLVLAKAITDPVARAGYAMAIVHRASPADTGAALDLIESTSDPAMLGPTAWAARVVGYVGTKGQESRLLKMLQNKRTRVFAALAIVLGADEDLLVRGMTSFASHADADGTWDQDLAQLQALYLDTFDGRELGRFDTLHLYEFVRNADRMRRIGSNLDPKGAARHAWAWPALRKGLSRLNLSIAVPGAIDRTILRYLVRQDAKVKSSTRTIVILTIRQLREAGALFSLAQAGDESARRALFELKNDPPTFEEAQAPAGYFSNPRI